MSGTEDTLQQMLARRKPVGFGSGMPEQLPRIHCADGFNLSVQASRGHYCSPRQNTGPWHEVEVGMPSERVGAFMGFMDGDEEREDPTDAVYGYVPLKTVDEVIDQHGGIKQEGR